MSGVGVGGRLGVRTQPRARVAAPVPAVAERVFRGLAARYI